MWSRLIPILLFALPLPVAAQTCTLAFTIEVTQGVGTIRPGAELTGMASYTTQGQSFRQEGGSTAHLASGEMQLGDSIRGPIWTLIVTSQGPAADLVGVYAHNVEGFTFAGVEFEGPMAITLFGPSGSRPDSAPPTLQEDWDRMDLRRAFTLQAPRGRDMLAGDVTTLDVDCT